MVYGYLPKSLKDEVNTLLFSLVDRVPQLRANFDNIYNAQKSYIEMYQKDEKSTLKKLNDFSEKFLSPTKGQAEFQNAIIKTAVAYSNFINENKITVKIVSDKKKNDDYNDSLKELFDSTSSDINIFSFAEKERFNISSMQFEKIEEQSDNTYYNNFCTLETHSLDFKNENSEANSSKYITNNSERNVVSSIKKDKNIEFKQGLKNLEDKLSSSLWRLDRKHLKNIFNADIGFLLDDMLNGKKLDVNITNEQIDTVSKAKKLYLLSSIRSNLEDKEAYKNKSYINSIHNLWNEILYENKSYQTKFDAFLEKLSNDYLLENNFSKSSKNILNYFLNDNIFNSNKLNLKVKCIDWHTKNFKNNFATVYADKILWDNNENLRKLTKPMISPIFCFFDEELKSENKLSIITELNKICNLQTILKIYCKNEIKEEIVIKRNILAEHIKNNAVPIVLASSKKENEIFDINNRSSRSFCRLQEQKLINPLLQENTNTLLEMSDNRLKKVHKIKLEENSLISTIVKDVLEKEYKSGNTSLSLLMDSLKNQLCSYATVSSPNFCMEQTKNKLEHVLTNEPLRFSYGQYIAKFAENEYAYKLVAKSILKNMEQKDEITHLINSAIFKDLRNPFKRRKSDLLKLKNGKDIFSFLLENNKEIKYNFDVFHASFLEEIEDQLSIDSDKAEALFNDIVIDDEYCGFANNLKYIINNNEIVNAVISESNKQIAFSILNILVHTITALSSPKEENRTKNHLATKNIFARSLNKNITSQKPSALNGYNNLSL